MADDNKATILSQPENASTNFKSNEEAKRKVEQMSPRGLDGKSEPNIKFIGKVRNREGNLQTGDPFEYINTGDRQILLPSADDQKNGFYHLEAALIVRLFPEQYKLIKRKGE